MGHKLLPCARVSLYFLPARRVRLMLATIPRFTRASPSQNLSENGSEERCSAGSKERRVDSILVLRGEIQECEHPRVEEGARR